MAGLRTTLVEVTPAMASEWLANHNQGNRPLSKHIVRTYAEEMRGGHWMLTHQGPAFDDTDRLIDGQHRLAAVIEADITVPMYVTFGADAETFAVLDINYKRQGSHLVSGPHATIKAAAARMLTEPPAIYYRAIVHNRDIVSVAASHPELSNAAVVAHRVYSFTKINPSTHAALLTLVMESPLSYMVEEWAEGLVTGAGLDANDPRLHLRNKWALGASHLNRARHEGTFFLIRAWNSFAKGESMSLLRLPQGGATKSTIPVPFLGSL